MILSHKENELNSILIATQTGGILGPFAYVLGKILEVIYNGFAALGVYNIGFCIILFTLVVRMLLLPLTIKQQKFTKLNAIMSPEIQAIQKKYKGKKDQQSQLAQQEEIRAVYDKYGTSPTGSCLNIVIQMPILFALYRVIMNIPAYVQPVKNLYIEVIHGLSAEQMKSFFNIDKVGSSVSGEKLNQCIDAMSGARVGNDAVKLTNGTTINTILEVADKNIASRIHDLNNFFGLDISMSPKSMLAEGKVVLAVALIIPILAGLFQFLSVQLSTKMNSAVTSDDNPMAGSLKTMNFVMPLVSVFMCYFFSTGIGIYWTAGSLIMMLQQLVINHHLNKVDMSVIIEENREKAAKKAEKRKEKQGIYREKVLQASQVNAKTVSNYGMSAEEKEERIRRAKEAGSKKGSLAEKANMVNEYNKRNEK